MSTQSLGDVSNHGTTASQAVERTESHAVHPARAPRAEIFTIPQTRFGRLLALLRPEAAAVLVAPLLCGATLAWWEQGQFDGETLFIVLISMLSGVLGVHALGETNDYRYILRPESKYLGKSSTRASNLIAAKAFSWRGALLISAGLLLVALGGAIYLMWLVGWPVLFFTLLSLLLYVLYVAPPARHPYLPWGLGEVGVFVGMGLLQVLNGYYVQAQVLTLLPVWSSIPLGLLCTLVVLTYTFIYQRRDWMLRKRTLVVSLQETRTLDLGFFLVLTTYTSLLLLVVFMILPPWILMGMLALPLSLDALKQVGDEEMSLDSRFALHHAMIRASIWTSGAVIVTLWLERTL